MLEKAIMGMASLRLISGSLEILAALMIIKVNEVEKALLINSSLALIGPPVLLMTTAIGLAGMADRINPAKILWICIGVVCILIGVRK
ncbi:YqhV family protein [Aneurinibacillus sp. REN35]|uniref:YqhV family protein n=1 Tax=Aneurinibacillus sp. REN35 TaxID=3237286 RepID=UPI00352725B9